MPATGKTHWVGKLPVLHVGGDDMIGYCTHPPCAVIVAKRDRVRLGYILSVSRYEFLDTGSGDGHEIRHSGDGSPRGSANRPSSYSLHYFYGIP